MEACMLSQSVSNQLFVSGTLCEPYQMVKARAVFSEKDYQVGSQLSVCRFYIGSEGTEPNCLFCHRLTTVKTGIWTLLPLLSVSLLLAVMCKIHKRMRNGES